MNSDLLEMTLFLPGLFWVVMLLAIVGPMFLGGVISRTFYQIQNR